MCRLANGPESFDLDLVAVRIGDTAMVGIPGEPFTDIGVQIKDTEGWKAIMPCCLTNGSQGYFPMQSAFDEGGLIRAQQLALLTSILESEAAAGNYVIVGGDWNHALCNSETMYESDFQVAPWVASFDQALLPAGFSVVRPDNVETVPTCRNNDVPYEEGYTYTVTVDGFIVSDNVKATAQNIDADFAYSDHNPVLLTFELVK